MDRGKFDRAEDIIGNATIAKCSAKNLGKNQYMVFDGKIRSEATEKLQLAADLQYAIARNELEIYVRPQ